MNEWLVSDCQSQNYQEVQYNKTTNFHSRYYLKWCANQTDMNAIDFLYFETYFTYILLKWCLNKFQQFRFLIGHIIIYFIIDVSHIVYILLCGIKIQYYFSIFLCFQNGLFTANISSIMHDIWFLNAKPVCRLYKLC